jgi:hypothetical protein
MSPQIIIPTDNDILDPLVILLFSLRRSILFLALSTELCTSSRREKKSYVPQEGHLVERRGAMSEVTSREGHLIVKRGETSGVAGRR